MSTILSELRILFEKFSFIILNKCPKFEALSGSTTVLNEVIC